MSWILANIAYKQNMSSSGNDYVRIHITDSMNSTSTVLTIQFVLMESPCENRGTCRGMFFFITFFRHLIVDVLLNGLCIYCLVMSLCSLKKRGCHGFDRSVVGFTTTCAISAYHQ